MKRLEEQKQKLDKIKNSKMYPIFESFYDGIIKPAQTTKGFYWELRSFDSMVRKLRMALTGRLFDTTNTPEEFQSLLGEKFTIDDIMKAIEIHKLALQKQYYPKNKKIMKIHLDSFILNEFSKSYMTTSFLSYWTLFDPKMVVERINSNKTQLLDTLILKYKEDIPIQKQNKILKTLELIEEDILSLKTSIIYPTTLEKFFEDYLKEFGLYPSDIATYDFRKRFVQNYRERFTI